jgi:plasmid stabilization system protein ParE
MAQSVIEIFVSRRAIYDFENIELHSIETWGPRVAEEYMAKFQTAFETLSNLPGLLISKPELSGKLRLYRVDRHWLFCVRVPEGIQVLAVRHGSEDLPARVAAMEPILIYESEQLWRQTRSARDQIDPDR